MLLLLHVDDLGGAVGITGVIQVTRFVPVERRIDDVLLVQTEQVTVTDAFHFIDNFALVGHLISDTLSYILDDNVPRCQVLQSEETIAMDFARADFDLFRLCLA